MAGLIAPLPSWLRVRLKLYNLYILQYYACRLVSEARRVTSTIRLSDFYLRTDIVQRGNNYDSFTRGLLTQPAQEQDKFFTKEVGVVCTKTRNLNKKTNTFFNLKCFLIQRNNCFHFVFGILNS